MTARSFNECLEKRAAPGGSRPTKLKGLHLSELSLVDEPANKGARVVLFKRDAATPIAQPPEPVQQEHAKADVPPAEMSVEVLEGVIEKMAEDRARADGVSKVEGYNRTIADTPDLYRVLTIAKSSPSGLAAAVAKKAAAEDRMDAMAADHARAAGITKAAAYVVLSREDALFKQLYRETVQIPS